MCMISFSPYYNPALSIPVLQMKKLRLREVNSFTKRPTASKWWNLNFNQSDFRGYTLFSTQYVVF